MKYMRRYHKFIFLVMFPLMAWLFVNSTINRHSHIVLGYVITHAHPFDKDSKTSGPIQPHKHSEDELILFDRISNFLIVMTGILFIAVFLQCILEIIISFKPVGLPVRCTFSSIRYRGPPISF